ncbi:hypothetical protein HanRHA438_Chr13g0629451 [Helianthus annuus]|nr:hypothetical protein HanRHA438_Chr13g0629451 [Helianthus annuus]
MYIITIKLQHLTPSFFSRFRSNLESTISLAKPHRIMKKTYKKHTPITSIIYHLNAPSLGNKRWIQDHYCLPHFQLSQAHRHRYQCCLDQIGSGGPYAY